MAMYAAAEFHGRRDSATGLTASGTGLAQLLMWLAMASGAVVLYEPAPYEVLFCGLLLLLPALGALQFTPAIIAATAVWLLVA
ncbi:MAG: hypothetical protein AB7O70_02410, partial [Hyphomicrobiales bacterium]